MGIITSEIIDLFSFLLPGFITSFLFYALTSFPKKSEFEAVVIALIYTVIIKAAVEWLGISGIFDEWNETYKTIWAICIALIIGLVWSLLYNNDIIHKMLRVLKITKQTSYPSEWYGAFSETKSFIILNLKDGKRITGWPLIWPNYPNQGHFVLEQAKWLTVAEDEKISEIPLETVDKIMIDTVTVEMVEFLKFQDELEGEKHERKKISAIARVAQRWKKWKSSERRP